METQDDAYRVDEQEYEEREEEALIRKSKTKDDASTEKFPVEIEKNEEMDKPGKSTAYFEEEGDKDPGQTVEALASSDGHTATEEVRIEQASGQTVEVLVFSNGFTAEETTAEEIEPVTSEDRMEKSGPEKTEVDLRTVLAEQNTYDLYCPNCKSCITRRVILRKRKRTVQKNPEVNREKFEDLPHAVIDNIDDHSVSEESEVFGCLQCFSIFIRTATGYEILSKIFGGRVGDDHSQDALIPQEEDTAASQDGNNVNCLAFFPKWRRGAPEDTDRDDFGKATEVCSVEHNNMSSDAGEVHPQTDKVPDETIPTSPTSSSLETIIEVTEQEEIAATNVLIPERLDMVSDGWDILKSIVYGGLAESIASLGVISSAAGGDASTLNILALGLANLIGGLLVLTHNIVELKQDTVRYTELIGQRQNFWRNTFVVIVSYILFGLVAPVTYGFSFRKSDNKEYKIVAVAISSLLCIMILALGKARVTDRSYIKKVLFYVALGVSASGISYVVGVFIRKLLEKVGWISESQSTFYSSSLTMGTVGTSSQIWVL